MRNSILYNLTFYQKDEEKQNKILKVNDIVVVKGRHYVIKSIKKNVYTVKDSQGRLEKFLIEDIEEIIFESSKQITIQDFIKQNREKTLKESLEDIKEKLKNPMLNLNSIKKLNQFKRSILKHLTDLNKQDKVSSNLVLFN
jgi:hypothetical protein